MDDFSCQTLVHDLFGTSLSFFHTSLSVKMAVFLKRFSIFCITICSIASNFVVPAIVYAQESSDEAIDCTDVRVNYSGDPALTREERIRLMDKAFTESLKKFELCQPTKKIVETNDTAAGGGSVGAAGDSGEPGEMNDEPTNGSVTGSTISGMEPSRDTSATEETETGESNDGLTAQDMGKTNSMNRDKIPVNNGMVPEDIPLADNDSALAAQIRYAAENETDSVKREQLWNEYRKYKGLPQKK